MKLLKTAVFAIACLASLNTQAGMIQNGDFQTCDFSGWNKDTDGAGDISTGNDFYIDGAGSSCRAAIEVDYFDPAGDPFGFPLDDVWFANTIYQELDLSGAAGSTFQLNIGFEVGSEAGAQDPFFIPDYFLIGLNDGFGNYYGADASLGFLLSPTDIDGSYRDYLTFDLDNSFTNTTGWFLDFQLNVGVDDTGWPDAYGSTLYVNDVSLVEIPAQIEQVPEPSTLAIFALGIAGLVTRKKIINKRNYHNEKL
ncbi:MAG: PEP-CTERM sorting domain-containing protein [Methylococcales bacterium]